MAEPVITHLGVDYSGHPPTPAALKAAGFTFACRYISPPQNPKNLSFPEAQALIAAGVDIVLVWEGPADGALGGLTGGQHDGARAKTLAEACGAPTTAAIYYAVDFGATGTQMGAVGQYQDGFGEGISPHPVGVYGSFDVVTSMMDRGAPFGWQTAAWSRGRRAPQAHLYQRVQQVRVDGTACDVDEATGPYGGWLSAPSPSPTPITPLPPSLTDPEEPTVLVPMQLPVTANGEGWWDADGLAADPEGKVKVGFPRPTILWAKFRGVSVNGNDGTPATNDHGIVRGNQHGDIVRISFSAFPPGSAPEVWVLVAP